MCTLFLKISKISYSQGNIQRNLSLEIKYYLLTCPLYLYYTLLSGLSIGFEVDGDILKVDGYGGQRPPTQVRGLGAADAPSGVQGQSLVVGPGGEAPRSKMNLMFDIAKN